MVGTTCLCIWSKIVMNPLVKPLFGIFQFSLETGNFPSNWKRGNIVPVHKKGNKDLINNYRPVSLLPIFSKIYEKCIYDTLYNYFEGNDLFSKSQSGFRKGDSCVSQLLSITHEIFKGFDANPSLDTCGIFSKSSVKWSDPGHFLKSQGNFFFIISMYPFFTYFWHLKLRIRP